MQTFDRANLKQLRIEMQTALSAVADKLGIKIDVGNISFESNQATIKCKAVTLSSNGTAFDEIAHEFTEHIEALGFSSETQSAVGKYYKQHTLVASDLHREFSQHGERYRIDGAKRRSRKYPIICTDLGTGKQFKFPYVTVARLLAEESE